VDDPLAALDARLARVAEPALAHDLKTAARRTRDAWDTSISDSRREGTTTRARG
jgi:hypothetical protein